MSIKQFARDELTRAGMFEKGSDYDGMLGEAVMKMIDVFADEGHSGFSARMAIDLFQRVARYEPLTPLTGEPDEWFEAAEGMWQNKRCAHVFKDSEDGPAYDINGRVFRDPDGACWTNSQSRVEVTFPYTPSSETVDRPAEADDAG